MPVINIDRPRARNYSFHIFWSVVGSNWSFRVVWQSDWWYNLERLISGKN